MSVMSGQAWHQDERYIPTRDRSLPTLDNRAVVPIGVDTYEWKGLSTPPERCFLRPLPGQPWPDADSTGQLNSSKS